MNIYSKVKKFEFEQVFPVKPLGINIEKYPILDVYCCYRLLRYFFLNWLDFSHEWVSQRAKTCIQQHFYDFFVKTYILPKWLCWHLCYSIYCVYECFEILSVDFIVKTVSVCENASSLFSGRCFLAMFSIF